jgi:hypothetical protein
MLSVSVESRIVSSFVCFCPFEVAYVLDRSIYWWPPFRRFRADLSYPLLAMPRVSPQPRKQMAKEGMSVVRQSASLSLFHTMAAASTASMAHDIETKLERRTYYRVPFTWPETGFGAVTSTTNRQYVRVSHHL